MWPICIARWFFSILSHVRRSKLLDEVLSRRRKQLLRWPLVAKNRPEFETVNKYITASWKIYVAEVVGYTLGEGFGGFLVTSVLQVKSNGRSNYYWHLWTDAYVVPPNTHINDKIVLFYFHSSISSVVLTIYVIVNECVLTLVYDLVCVKLTFTFATCHRPSVCRLSVCLSVTFVRRTQPVENFINVSSPFDTLATLWPSWKILRSSSQGNPSGGMVKRMRGSQI